MSHRHVQRLVGVAQEHQAVRDSLSLTLAQMGASVPVSLLMADRNLEGTYTIRLFSEFEGILRDYLATNRPGRPVPRTAQVLIDRCAAHASVPNDRRLAAHDVRNHRNSLVHAGGLTAPVLTFRQSFSALNRFLASLP